jgi:hypothetical protein
VALTKKDLAAIAAMIAAAQAPTGKPAQVAASSTVVRGTHIGPSGKPDGRDFVCTVAGEECGAYFRSADRAAVHGDPKAGAHIRRTA